MLRCTANQCKEHNAQKYVQYCRLQVTIDAVDDVTGLSVIIKVELRQGMPPPYLSTMFMPTVSQQQRQRLRSLSTSTLLLPHTQTRYGDRNFTVAGPVAWNCLSAELRRPDLSMAMFRRCRRTRYSLLFIAT